MGKEKEVIIATHGKLAEGLVSALNIIVGKLPNLKTVCCYIEADFNLEKTIEEIMVNHDFEHKDLIVCTDMMGGSVNNGFTKYLGQYPFHLVTNTNLAFLVDLMLSPDSVASLASKTGDDLFTVKYVNQLISSFDEDDDL